jgi:hypothetical protein
MRRTLIIGVVNSIEAIELRLTLLRKQLAAHPLYPRIRTLGHVRRLADWILGRRLRFTRILGLGAILSIRSRNRIHGYLLKSHMSGSELLSGGSVGPEGSTLVIPVMLLIAVTVHLTTDSRHPSD